MNRLVLIGNGFDLAHDMKTSYADFIDWYWEQKWREIALTYNYICEDQLSNFEIISGDTRSWHSLYHFNRNKLKDKNARYIFKAIINDKVNYKVSLVPFFQNILKSIETKGWVDIENEYYKLLEQHSLIEYSTIEIEKLNNQLLYLQNLLAIYLKEINQQEISANKKIKDKIYAPIETRDVSIGGKAEWEKYIEDCKIKDKDFWDSRLYKYGIIGSNRNSYLFDIDEYKNNPEKEIPRPYRLPESIMLLDFNYTKTVNRYMKTEDIFIHNQIHGRIEAPESMIFGYGDEFDEKYRKLQDLNNNDCLTNIKTIKYQESDNYRKVLQFIESAPFQVCIMGHSCGNSDRTLLNTIFEHKNCISIKPYYYKKSDGTDNYIELVQNISRNFKDMKLMRDRVVNKMYCEPLTGE